MAAHRRKAQALKSSSNVVDQKKTEEVKDAEKVAEKAADKAAEKAQLALDHLPPLPLVFTVMACSGLLWVFALRDLLATGRNIAGTWDEAMLMFTKSGDWFDDSKGWKSQQGGFSAIQSITTDANNMGGLFIRKLGGAAVLAVQTQKLFPLLFHPSGAMWNMGHFKPLLCTAMIGNIITVALYGLYMEDFSAAGANTLPKLFISALLLETVVVMYYIFTQRTKGRAPSVALPDGKKPTSVTSRIVTRTVIIVSSFLSLIAARDVFFPGQILDFIPRDDIYLEWTGAFLHSPPEDSHEADDQAMASPLYIGDKFVSQIMALHILILCMYKFLTALFIRFGHDGSGLIKCKMIWKVQAFGDALVVLLFRLFAPAALSASLDLRWHLMAFGYEMFILGLYAYY